MTKMLKILFVFSFVAIASSAEAKVCFLPGVLAGDGCFDNTAYVNNPCPGFTRTNPCPSGYAQETCVNGSQTLYKCTCQSGNFTRDNGLGTTYTCTKSYDSSCGCSPQDTECNKSTFKLAQEDGYCQIKFPGSEPSETCTNPSDGKIFYKDCECSSSVYPYTCKENGLKAPSGTNSCTDRGGNKHYSRCDCADNWQSNPCNERTDGCTAVGKRVLRGDNEYCYSCTAEKCAKAGEINLDNYWCAMPQGSQTDCAKLGYTYVQSGKCPDGSIGIRCPYNKQYMYCLSICNTAADTNCAEWSGTGKDCTCTTCKSGYELKNGKCEQKISCATGTYKTKSECETANPDAWKCILNSAGCYEPITLAKICATGTYQTQEECEKVNGNSNLHRTCEETSNGCWAPWSPTISCSGYKLSKCPANGVCSTCPSDKSKFKLTGCNTNYYLDTDKCVSCADAYVIAKQKHDYAANSYFACCTGGGQAELGGQIIGYACMGAGLGRCRSGSDTSYPGSWNDGFIKYYMKQVPSSVTNSYYVDWCKEALNGVIDETNDFNKKCPNQAINIKINTNQCNYIYCGGKASGVILNNTYKGGC